MGQLDAFTLFVTSFFLNAFLVLYLLFFHLKYKLSKGIPLFIIAVGFLTLSSSFFALTNKAGFIVTVIASNTFCYLGLALIYLSLRLFLNKKISYFLLIIYGTTTILIIIEQYIFSIVFPNINIRIVFISTVFSGIFLHSIHLLYSNRRQSSLAGFMLSLVYGLLATVFFVRIVSTIINPVHGDTLFDLSKGIHLISSFLLILLCFASALGFLLLNYQSLHQTERQRNREKEVLLQELFHRTKNNMQVISSYLQLQRYNSNNEEVQNQLQIAENRIETMALAHKKLYQSNNLSKIDLKEYVDELIQMLKKNNGIMNNITITSDIQEITVLIDVAIPIGLIINELITNSCNHAFPHSKGEISIKINLATENKLCICVKDNGIGLPSAFDINTSTSLGIKTVLNTVQNQLMGNIKYESEKGLTWFIEFENTIYHERV